MIHPRRGVYYLNVTVSCPLVHFPVTIPLFHRPLFTLNRRGGLKLNVIVWKSGEVSSLFRNRQTYRVLHSYNTLGFTYELFI